MYINIQINNIEMSKVKYQIFFFAYRIDGGI